MKNKPQKQIKVTNQKQKKNRKKTYQITIQSTNSEKTNRRELVELIQYLTKEKKFLKNLILMMLM